jgi:hypothetical protein
MAVGDRVEKRFIYVSTDPGCRRISCTPSVQTLGAKTSRRPSARERLQAHNRFAWDYTRNSGNTPVRSQSIHPAGGRLLSLPSSHRKTAMASPRSTRWRDDRASGPGPPARGRRSSGRVSDGTEAAGRRTSGPASRRTPVPGHRGAQDRLNQGFGRLDRVTDIGEEHEAYEPSVMVLLGSPPVVAGALGLAQSVKEHRRALERLNAGDPPELGSSRKGEKSEKGPEELRLRLCAWGRPGGTVSMECRGCHRACWEFSGTSARDRIGRHCPCGPHGVVRFMRAVLPSGVSTATGGSGQVGSDGLGHDLHADG